MDKMANGIQSEEFSGEKEPSDQQRSFKNTVIKRISTLFSPTISSSRKVNTVKIGQLQAQQNKTPLSRKPHEQPANRSQEKTSSAIRVSLPATKTAAGKTPALKEETTVDTQTSQPEQSTGGVILSPRRSSSVYNHKTSAVQHGTVKTRTSSGSQTAEPSTRCKKSSASPETSTPLSFIRKRKTQTSVSQSRPHASSNTPSSSTSSFSVLNDEPVHHIKWDGFSRTRENVGFTCALCEEDLSYMPSDNYESEYYEDQESDPLNYPEVAVLPCGHSFHVRCFVNTIPDEQCTDPPCVFCASYLT